MPNVELNDVNRSCGGRPQPAKRVEAGNRPLVAENHQPGIGSHHEAGPEAHADRDQEDDRDPVVAARHHVGERIAEQQAGDRDDQRGLERVEQHAAVERNGEYPPIMLERHRRVGHAEQQHVADRNDEQQDDREHGRRHQQPSGHLLAPPGVAEPMDRQSRGGTPWLDVRAHGRKHAAMTRVGLPRVADGRAGRAGQTCDTDTPRSAPLRPPAPTVFVAIVQIL